MARGRILESTSPQRTEAIGAELAGGLESGDLVLVSGSIGAGKTTLVRGACRALGVIDRVTSPTFTLAHRHRGRLGVSHLDLYRLRAGLQTEVPGLLEEYLESGDVVFVEWPRARDWPVESRLRVSLMHAGGDRRRIVVEE